MKIILDLIDRLTGEAVYIVAAFAVVYFGAHAVAALLK